MCSVERQGRHVRGLGVVPRDPFPALEAPGSDPTDELDLVNGANLVFCLLYFGLRQDLPRHAFFPSGPASSPSDRNPPSFPR